MKNLKTAENVSWILLNAIERDFYHDPDMKNILRHTIRRVSDGTNCWHASNEFRSKEVVRLTAHLSKRSAYHDFCNKNFRHEHVVPATVIYEYIGQLKEPTYSAILDTLIRFCITATVTREEDQRLDKLGLKSKMPAQFHDYTHELFDDPFARYKIAGIFENLEPGFRAT